MFGTVGRMLSSEGRDVRGKAISIFMLLAVANVAIWCVAGVTFHRYPVLLGTAFLAYSFGLRHAVDADHIAAIDNVMRKLMQQGERPVGVGFFFSLGHSTVVFGLSAALALTAVSIKSRFSALDSFGNVFGTLVSASFLFAIAIMNIVILGTIFRTFHRVKSGAVYAAEDLSLLLAKRGLLGRLFRRLFGLIGHSTQMYWVGLLFGLGFDTATEVGLLGISATEASRGLPIWSIMVFPALFTAGMALIDTTDGILMLGAYGWAFAKPLRRVYYNLTVTSVSVLVALIVGGLETLGLFQGHLSLSGPFWDRIAVLNSNFGTLGYVIIGIFALSWIVSLTIYKLRRYDEIEVTLAE
jgi:nickel/cobalt transporter (NiCoT) family protein